MFRIKLWVFIVELIATFWTENAVYDDMLRFLQYLAKTVLLRKTELEKLIRNPSPIFSL